MRVLTVALWDGTSPLPVELVTGWHSPPSARLRFPTPCGSARSCLNTIWRQDCVEESRILVGFAQPDLLSTTNEVPDSSVDGDDFVVGMGDA
jgi:hypothetical protein